MPDRYRRRISPETYQRLVQEAKAAAKAQEAPTPEPSIVKRYLPAGIRGLGMLLGLTPLRGLGASAVAETVAQGIEGRFNPSEVLTAGVSGGIGGAATQSIFKNLSKPAVAALKGAGWGALQPVARGVLDADYEATPEAVATGGLIGGVTGGGLAKLFGGLGRTPARTPVSEEYSFSKYPLLERTPKELEQLAVSAQADDRPDVAIDILKRTLEAPGKVAPPSLMNRLIALQKAEAARAAKVTRETRAAEEIATAREGMGTPKERVAETLAAPTQGGVERLTRVFKPAKTPRAKAETTPEEFADAGLEDASDAIVAATPELPKDPEKIYQAWRILRGLPDNMATRRQFPWGQVGGEMPRVGGASRMAPEGPTRPPEPSIAPEPTPDIPVTVAAPEAPTARFLGWQADPDGPPLALYNIEGGPSHGSTVGEETLRRLGIAVPETPPPSIAASAPAVGKREAILRESDAGARQLEQLEAVLGREIQPPVTARGTFVDTPEPMLRAASKYGVFKGPVDVAGTIQRQAKQESNIPEVAKRYLGMSLQTEAKRAGLPTRGGGGSPETLRKFLSEEIGPVIGREGATRPVAAPEAPIAPTGKPKIGPMVPQEPFSQSTSVGDLLERWVSEVEELRRMGLPPEKLDEATSQIVARLMEETPGIAKGFISKARREAGEVAFPLLARLGLGAGGAAIGGAVSDEDPLTGAIVGFGAGVTLPSLIKIATEAGERLAVDPAVPPAIKAVLAPLAEGSPEKATRVFWEQIPEYVRAGMLIGPNTPSNFFLGPYGSGLMAGLELKMAGNPTGDRILAGMEPVAWANHYRTIGWNKAKAILGDTQSIAQERIEGIPDLGIAQFPGIGMMAGDMTTRDVLQAAGLSEELARRYTHTSEPVMPLIKSIINLQRTGGAWGKLALPFARTLGNIAEQSAVRTPFIGPKIQRMYPALAYPEAVQTQQQILGTAVPLAAGAIGYNAPNEGENPSRTVLSRALRGAVTNIAGPYAGLAGVGYGVGRALAAKEPTVGRAIQRAGTEAVQTVPLPTADIPISWLSFLRKLVDREPITAAPAGTPFGGFINPLYLQNRSTARRSRQTRSTRTQRTER